jgi:hypothetical protein
MTTRLTASSIQRNLWIVFIAAIPALTCILLIGSQANLFAFIPTWSDEIFNWHQVLTFKTAGFQGGYYTINEAAAAAPFTHFYTYGPWFIMLYGSLGAVMGWEHVTFILFNMVFVTLALIVFCHMAQLRGRQLWMLGIVLTTFWCLITFLPTAMQEALQQSLAILIAAVIYRALTKRHQIGWSEYITSLILLTVAVLLRVSWAVVVFPYLWLTARPKWMWRIGSLIIGIVIIYAMYALGQYTGSPGNNSVAATFEKFSVSFDEGWRTFSDYFTNNFNRFFNPTKHSLDLLQTIQVLVLVVGAVIIVVVEAFRRRFSIEAAFHVYNLTTIIVSSMALYIVGGWGDYRVIGTHLMVSVLLLIAFKRYLPLQLFALSNALFIPLFFGFFQSEVVSKYQTDVAALDNFHQAFEAVAPYTPNAENAWCNTVIFPVSSFNPYLVSVPAGMGLSFFRVATVPGYRSQYVLLDQNSYDIVRTKTNPPDLEPILSTPIGILYRNHSANCAG